MISDFVQGMTDWLNAFASGATTYDISFVHGNEYLFLAISLGIFVVLFLIFESAWMFWRNRRFEESFKSILLEIKVPREIIKSPRAMEQVLFAMHSLRNAPSILSEQWIDGEITRWYSLEIASFGGEVHFYVRTPFKQRNLVEAAFLGYYPDVELVEVDDYATAVFPRTLQDVYAQGYDVYGAELKLAKPDPFPLRSYKEFETADEAQLFDPVTNLVEAFGKIKREEMMGMQIMFYPLHPKAREKWQPLVEEMRAMKGKKSDAKLSTSFPGGPLPHLEVKKSEEDEFGKLSRAWLRTPGETESLKKLEENLGKPAFKAVLRFIYFSPKSLFYDSFPRRAVPGAMNQYADIGSNYFALNAMAGTRTGLEYRPYIFPKAREKYRKQHFLHRYQERDMPPHQWIGYILTSTPFFWNTHSVPFFITTESLATIFHLPTTPVMTAPHVKRVESKKGGPPAGLPIFGDEEKLKKFM